MKLGTIFQLSMYGLACLAALMLALAEGRAIPLGITVPLAMLAIFFNERWQLLCLSLLWANVLGLLAFGMAAVELFGGDIEARLLSGAHLLAYLSWIIFFQTRSPKKYWMMCALGVLQVAVGSILTNDGWYGTLLVGYLFGSIWTLSVFSLYQGQHHIAEEQMRTVPPPTASSVRSPSRTGWQGRQSRGGTEPSLGAVLRRRSAARGAIQYDPNDRWIGLRFAFGTLATACVALGIASLFFLFIPRVWIGKHRIDTSATVTGGRALSGFTEDVRLGDFGEILESTEPVLEVRLFDNETGEMLDLESYTAQFGYDEPLFRGTVLGAYDNGRWSSRYPEGTLRLRAKPRRAEDFIRQEIRLEPIDTRFLFALHPVLAARMEGRRGGVEMSRASSMLARSSNYANAEEAVSYNVYSPKPPSRPPSRPALPSFSNAFDRYQYTALPPRGLERLTQLARRVAGIDAGRTKPSPLAMAQRVESYLRDSGEFGYSLDSRIQDPRIDPVEDFLFNRKTGHCEYYASALTLMLRSVGIPARMVSGFKGGMTNRLTGGFEVEQRHAHTWVEAEIDHRWLVFDATPPAARSQSVESMATGIRTWHELHKVFSEFWSGLVVNLSLSQQRQAFFIPMQRSAHEWWEALRSGHVRFSTILRAATEFLSSPDRWISWQGGGATFVLLVLGAGIVWLVRRCWRLVRHIRSRLREHQREARTRVEFYERFRKLCEARGLFRRASQTQREFARDVDQSLRDLLTLSGLSTLPEELVEVFYLVRFGHEPIEPRQADLIDRQLSRLEQALSASRCRSVASRRTDLAR